MKKYLLSAFALAATSAAMAQQPAAGTFSVIPRVGLSIAKLPGDIIYTASVGNGSTLTPRFRTSFMGGVDLDYQVLDNLSVTLGAYYAQQGCNYKNSFVLDKNINIFGVGTGYSDASTQLHYINVPLTANVYIAPGFALKAGVQVGFAISGKTVYTEAQYTYDSSSESIKSEAKNYDQSLNSTMKKTVFAIPVGLSYEFANVIIDARYNIGLTPFQQVGEYKGSKNRVFTVSAGYRFAL